MSKTIVVDFDGVLHWYRKGWMNGAIYDDPTPGSQAAMKQLLDAGFRVVVFSTRALDRNVNGVVQEGQADLMRAWFHRHGFPTLEIWKEPGKPMGIAYIDDRAVRFNGDWDAAVKEAIHFVPWNQSK